MRRTHDWPGAVRDVRRYCHDCVECQKAKPAHHKPFGLLNPLPVPPEPWHTVTMDFITDLPLSSTYGSTTWDSILVVVDKLTKMAHYIPVQKTMSVADFIEVFIRDVVKHHGMPEVLVTDRDKLFTSENWTSFCFHMRCCHNLLTAFHPQKMGKRKGRTSLWRHTSVYLSTSSKGIGPSSYPAPSSRIIIPCMLPRVKAPFS